MRNETSFRRFRTDVDFAGVGSKLEETFQSLAERHQVRTGRQRVSERVQIRNIDKPGDRQPKVRVVGDVHTDFIEPGDGGDR